MSIGERIRKFRVEKGYKQNQMETFLDIDQSTYSKIENDKYKLDINLLKKISDVLEVDLIKLITDDKITINHTNNDSSSGDAFVLVKTNISEKFIEYLLLQNSELKQEIKELKEKFNN